MTESSLKKIKHEKSIMEMCNNPYLVRLKATFQDVRHFYYLMEYCQGGDLLGVLQKKPFLLTEECIKDIVASTVLGLQYLHERNIIYRDIKPENILIDHNNYIKLADFGLSRFVDSEAMKYSKVGTPDYVAPEVLE